VITPTLSLLEAAFANVDLTAQPAAGAHALPASMYRDGPIVDIERSAVFARHWQYLGHRSQWSTDGDILMASFGGLDVAVTRTAQGLRGFHAVCRHRAGPLEPCRGGGKTFLRCRYHAWAYGLEGQLLSAPEMRGAEDFDETAIRLPEIELAEFEGLVFGRLEPGPASLEDVLDGVAPRLARAGHSLPALRFHERVSYDIDCNWKTYVDNYLEGYHVPLLHPLLNSAVDMKTYSVEVPDDTYCIHRAGQVQGSASAGVWVFRYPNLAINVYADGMNVERIVPLSSTRTAVVYDYFAHDVSEAKIQSMVEMSNVTLDEDQAIAELVQRNLDAGIYEAGPLSPRHENALAWFQGRIRETTGAR